MSKPWDNEPTPIIDNSDMYYFDTAVDVGRNLERRMRAAERLLEDVLGDATIYYEGETLIKIANHLEASRKED